MVHKKQTIIFHLQANISKGTEELLALHSETIHTKSLLFLYARPGGGEYIRDPS